MPAFFKVFVLSYDIHMRGLCGHVHVHMCKEYADQPGRCAPGFPVADLLAASAGYGALLPATVQHCHWLRR